MTHRIRMCLMLLVIGIGSACNTVVYPQITVSDTFSGAPVGCQEGDVVRQIMEFAEAFNSEDTVDVVQSFDPNLAWFSVTTEDSSSTTSDSHVAAYTIDELKQYVTTRQENHEQLQLQTIDIHSWDAARELVHFSFTLTRQADDILPVHTPHLSIGKGAYYCPNQSLFVWSMGTNNETMINRSR